MKEISSFGQNS